MDKGVKVNVEQLLSAQISALRKEMETTGVNQGLCHKKTVELSQKLDQVIIQYQLIQ